MRLGVWLSMCLGTKKEAIISVIIQIMTFRFRLNLFFLYLVITYLNKVGVDKDNQTTSVYISVKTTIENKTTI